MSITPSPAQREEVALAPDEGRYRRCGFTLIEVLVVIALTVILLTVLFLPLVQAFNFTGQAQANAQAQDAARLTTEQLTRELGSAAAVRDTTGLYLDLPLDTKNGNTIIAHAYNAYVDIVPPRVATGNIVDPTIDQSTPTSILGTGSVSPTTGQTSELTTGGVGLPLAAGSTVVRYFIGLRYPIDPKYVPGSTAPYGLQNGTYTPANEPADPQPYLNPYDEIGLNNGDVDYDSYVVQQNLVNTYQLYRVNFQPYAQIATTTGTGAGATTTTQYGPNTNLFAEQSVNGSKAPILDDPDFFRIVREGEADPIGNEAIAPDNDNGTYTVTSAQDHNDRVYNWFKIAKEVVSTRDIDLVGLPRTGGKIVYDASGNPVDSYDSGMTESFPLTESGTPAAASVPVPIVRTTVNFAPALIANDPMAPSNTSDQSQGYGQSPNSAVTSLPFVPTLFQAQYGNWAGTPIVTIDKSGALYQTRLFTTADSTSTSPGPYTLGVPNYTPNQTTPSVGDLILASGVTGTSAGTPVYDITASAPILAGSQTSATAVYDALTIDKNTGEVNFALPALPVFTGTGAAPTPASAYFQVTGPFNMYNTLAPAQANVIYFGDYNLLDGTPLPAPSTENTTTAQAHSPSPVKGATLVVNSERVVGPDMASGAIGGAPTTDMVQYTRVDVAAAGSDEEAPSGPNQYTVNYQDGTITFSPSYTPSSVQIAFSYQNNLSQPTAGGAEVADTVQASYYTSAVMRLNLGVRVYSSATSASQYFSLNSQVGVGNAKAN